MTYKQKAIEACRQLAEKYRNPQGEPFFCACHCPLCVIWRGCRGCPLHDEGGGCSDFRTYQQAANAIIKIGGTCFYPPKAPTLPEFIARAEFFEKIIPILEKIPARRFTPSGWTFFKELDRDW